jgi:ATP/ADP translocase
MCLGSVSVSTPYVAIILALIFVFWILAVKALGHLFAEISEDEAPKPTPKTTYAEASS